MKQHQIEKYNTLIVLQGELNVINDERRYYEKLRGKFLSAAQNKVKEQKDFEHLQALSKRQEQQIRKITKEIQTLRLKIKPQDQFSLNERVIREQKSPKILTFPAGYSLDACDDSPRTNQSTNPYSSGASGVSGEYASSDASDAV